MDQKTEIPGAALEKPNPKKKKRRMKKTAKKAKRQKQLSSRGTAKFPRHSVEKALRVPRAIIEQNAGRSAQRKIALHTSAWVLMAPTAWRSAPLKYGFLERPRAGFIALTDRARQAIRPQKPGDEIEAMRQAVLAAPDISDVYKHYRGEYLPDGTFFEHALVDKFGIPAEKVSEFTEIFLASLQSAKLVEKKEDEVSNLRCHINPGTRGSG